MGTAIVGLVLVAVVAAIIVSLAKNKKKGKHSCGGNCAHCAAGCSHGGVAGVSTAEGGVDTTKCGAGGRLSPSSCTTILEIDGMMCPMCESHVNDAIRNNFSVKSVKSSHKTGITQVVSEEMLDEAKLRSVIKETGYELKSISAN